MDKIAEKKLKQKLGSKHFHLQAFLRVNQLGRAILASGNENSF